MSAFDECRRCGDQNEFLTLIAIGDVPMCAVCAHDVAESMRDRIARALVLVEGLRQSGEFAEDHNARVNEALAVLRGTK